MFFGKPSKPEEINARELTNFLNSLFDKRLESLDSRASSTVRELEHVKIQFSEACDNFEKLDVEPDIEELYITNTSSLKNQKVAYARTLKRIIKEASNDDSEAKNIYTKYKRVFLNYEDLIANVLKTNGNYKQVVYCYSNHLGAFKKAFSNLERLFKVLRYEIDSKADEWSKYNAVLIQIDKLNSFAEEIATIDASINVLRKAIDHGSKDLLGADEKTLNERLANERAELETVRSEISGLLYRITMLTAPLERAARKFDHLSARKRKLSEFISNPTGSLMDKSDSDEFVSLLNELKEDVDSGKLEVKGDSKTNALILELMNSNIYEMAVSLKTLEARRAGIEDKIMVSEKMVRNINSLKNDASKYVHDLNVMEKRINEIGAIKESTKNKVEALIFDYYRKRVGIISF